MAIMNFGGVDENVVTREEFPLEKAREILTFTDLRSCEIAEKIGFSDPHYFSAAFKRATGLTPREYRESHLF